MTSEAELNIKELYEQVADTDSASYDVFRKKLHRLLQGNVRTKNRAIRNGGKEPRKMRPPSDFLAYDGEGWGTKYALLANSFGERLVNTDGLTTLECLEFLTAKYDTRVKRIFFSFGYDVNHIIKDFDDEQVAVLLKGRTVEYMGYRVSYIPGKILSVNNIKYYDVFSFFSTSFLNVVRRMLGPEAVTDSLKAGKAGRGSFDSWNMDEIIRYNDEELDLLVKIMERLKEAFINIGVYLTEWYGPGAVAKYWFKEHGVEPKETHSPGALDALHSAYYGGRFEQITLGKVKNVYEYDLHSAYPTVMQSMPYFRSWRKTKGPVSQSPYSIWRITFDLRADQLISSPNRKSRKPHGFMPLPVRARNGHLCFPMMGSGWYWQSEVKVLLDFFPDAKVTIHEGYVATVEGQPFSWIKPLYDYRQTLKEKGDLSEYAIKVGLNSLYGKTAQRVGTTPYFSLAWAGYITSSTRAKLARAGYEGGSRNVLGFATDALFTTVPINVPLSNNLGDWDKQHFTEGLFFQSGIYRLTRTDGSTLDRYRGNPTRAGIDDIIAQLQRHPKSHPRVKVVKFITHQLAVHAKKVYGPYRLQFINAEHEVMLDAAYKRHYNFPCQFTKSAVRINDFSVLLRTTVTSDAKVFVDDDDWIASEFYLNGEMQLEHADIVSRSAPMKDLNTQRLMEEAEMMASELGVETLSSIEELPTTEDPMQ